MHVVMSAPQYVGFEIVGVSQEKERIIEFIIPVGAAEEKLEAELVIVVIPVITPGIPGTMIITPCNPNTAINLYVCS